MKFLLLLAVSLLVIFLITPLVGLNRRISYFHLRGRTPGSLGQLLHVEVLRLGHSELLERLPASSLGFRLGSSGLRHPGSLHLTILIFSLEGVVDLPSLPHRVDDWRGFSSALRVDFLVVRSSRSSLA